MKVLTGETITTTIGIYRPKRNSKEEEPCCFYCCYPHIIKNIESLDKYVRNKIHKWNIILEWKN